MLLRERYRRPTMAVLIRGAAGPPCLLDWIIGDERQAACWSCPAPTCPTTLLLQPLGVAAACPSAPRVGVIAWGPSSRGGGRRGRGARGELLV